MGELTITIPTTETLRARMMTVWELVNKGIKAGPVTVTMGRPKRSREQNRHFQALIGEISQQVTPGGQKYSAEVWRAMLVDQFEDEMRGAGTPLSKPGAVVPSLDGLRVVTVRPSTTRLTKREAAAFIEFLYAWGVEHGVKFTPPAVEIYEQYMGVQQ